MQIIKCLRNIKQHLPNNRKITKRSIKNNRISGTILKNINNENMNSFNITQMEKQIVCIHTNQTVGSYDGQLHKPNCVCFIILFLFHLASNVLSTLKANNKYTSKNNNTTKINNITNNI